MNRAASHANIEFELISSARFDVRHLVKNANLREAFAQKLHCKMLR